MLVKYHVHLWKKKNKYSLIHDFCSVFCLFKNLIFCLQFQQVTSYQILNISTTNKRRLQRYKKRSEIQTRNKPHTRKHLKLFFVGSLMLLCLWYLTIVIAYCELESTHFSFQQQWHGCFGTTKKYSILLR